MKELNRKKYYRKVFKRLYDASDVPKGVYDLLCVINGFVDERYDGLTRSVADTLIKSLLSYMFDTDVDFEWEVYLERRKEQ